MKSRDRMLGSSRTITLLVTLVLVSLSLILLSQNQQFAPVQNFFYSLATPVQRAVSDTTFQVDGWLKTLQQMDNLRKENADLKAEIERLLSQSTGQQDLRAENERLQQMLSFQIENPQFRNLPANVLGSDPSSLSQELIIDRGSRDGIKERMAVTSPGGFLVGTIRTVSLDRATVLLVTDVDSSISVVTDRSNVGGVVTGQAQSGGRLLVQHIPQAADVLPNDLIKTSGSGGIMPKGLLVGQITEVHTRDVGMEQEAEAYPLTELQTSSLEQVLVITSAGDTDADSVPQSPGNATITPTATITATLTPGTPAPTGTPGATQ